MAKLLLYKRLEVFLVIFSLVYHSANAQYQVTYISADSASGNTQIGAMLQSTFKTRLSCEEYINNLPTELQAKGYSTSSIDSVYYDTATAIVHLYLGQQLKFAYLDASGIDKNILEQSGWQQNRFENKPFRFDQLELLKKRMLNYLENNGYPFANIQMDSMIFKQDKFFGKLHLEKGPLYKIDSIRVRGTAKISNRFLQRYLDISNGSLYQRSKLENISKKFLELPYLQEDQTWNLTMLGTGSILNVYLVPKKSSQVNVLLGFLPSGGQTSNINQTKMQLTGEANINLRNALSYGELISLNWQQIQVKSPRLDLAFQQPYLFGSPFGISTSFNLFKKDSSYINLSLLAGIQYQVSTNRTGRVFIQNLKTNIIALDTFAVKSAKRLPNEIDVSSVNIGVDYEINTTNFRFNPRKGSEVQLMLSAGSRKIKKNEFILKLSDPSFNYASLYDSIKEKTYQFRTKIMAAHYFPLGGQSTIKTALNAGWFQSPSIFRNEVFQIGGYKLLRGFDEESIFASQYLVANVEYRYIIGLNSFLFSFLDLGWAANKSKNFNNKNQYTGIGAGLAFETKAGIFNISFAAGKRDDARFNPRQSKIHLGYVNFF